MIDIKTRVLSAIVMILIVVPLIILGNWPFKIFTIILAIASMYELIKVRGNERKTPLLVSIFSYILIGGILLLSNGNASYNIDLKIIVLLFALILLPIVFYSDNKKYNINDGLFILGAMIFLMMGYNSFIIVRNIDIMYFIYLILITIFTDMFGLFTGILIGKHKLCEKISPKKTIEGAIGGTLVGTIVATLFYILIIDSTINIFLVIGITLFLSVVGQVGDLFFSNIKRNYDVKDFSKLIPGHGGILDRVDSLLFVIIFFMLFINIL